MRFYEYINETDGSHLHGVFDLPAYRIVQELQKLGYDEEKMRKAIRNALSRIHPGSTWYGAKNKNDIEKALEMISGSTPKQEHTSADTSLNQVAAIFKKGLLKPGTRNLDHGGGKYDAGTEHLKTIGVENHVYDPFNRSEEHNKAVLEKMKKNPPHTITNNNVLNVIKEPEIRHHVISHVYELLQKNGTAYFQIYEGSKSGEGKVTSKGWQNNKHTREYIEEVKKVFGNAKTKGNIIIATKE